jgi:hypothetical protein
VSDASWIVAAKALNQIQRHSLEVKKDLTLINLVKLLPSFPCPPAVDQEEFIAVVNGDLA